MDEILYLPHATIVALSAESSRFRGALAQAFRLHAHRRIKVNPKQMLEVGSGHFFQSLCAASSDLGYAANKWIGVASDNALHGVPSVNGLVVLSEFTTGVPVAVLDGASLTVVRTAAMSALAGEYLADPDSRSIGFVGCGRQAAGHLAAFLDLLPGLRRAVCVSAGHASAEALAGVARENGLDAVASRDPDAALACDVVVTTVPSATGSSAFLDARRLRPGCFVSAVDLGASWIPDSLSSLDLIATDDRAQADTPSTRGRLPYSGRFHADLAEMVSEPVTHWRSPSGRTMFLFPGFALADLAAAVALYEAARSASVGTILPR